MCTTNFKDCVIYRDYPWTTPTWKLPKVLRGHSHSVNIIFFTELGVLICIHQALQFTTIAHLDLKYPSFVIWAWVNPHQDRYIRNKHKRNEGRNIFLMAENMSKLHQLKETGIVNKFFNTMKVVNQHFQRHKFIQMITIINLKLNKFSSMRVSLMVYSALDCVPNIGY